MELNKIKYAGQRLYDVFLEWLGKSITQASCNIKLMKGKALRKHSLHEKTAASVLLKLFISGYE